MDVVSCRLQYEFDKKKIIIVLFIAVLRLLPDKQMNSLLLTWQVAALADGDALSLLRRRNSAVYFR